MKIKPQQVHCFKTFLPLREELDKQKHITLSLPASDADVPVTMAKTYYIQHQWDQLPRHILLIIFTHLSPNDRVSGSLTCRNWNACFNSPGLWRNFSFHFEKPEDKPKILSCLEKYDSVLRVVQIHLNPRHELNCTNASRVLTHLARCKQRSLETLSIHFTKGNPLFFKGLDILSSLAELFGPPNPEIKHHSFLKEINLSEMSVTFDDKLFNLISANHPYLEVMNMQNNSLTCQVTPTCIENFIRKCKRLRKLITFYKCISDDALCALLERGREQIRYLSLLCKMEEKYHKLISVNTWVNLKKCLPDLRVALLFDHTSDRQQIRDILCPKIPLVELSMRSLTELHEEVDIVVNYFSRSLEIFTISTKRTDRLEQALINLAAHSMNLKVFHCYCGLRESTIKTFLEFQPHLTDYTLSITDLEDSTLPPLFTGRFAHVQAMKEMGLFE
ncbi:F-box/LRR-repeat protein 8 [Holothuria leucospilota]|uniref:F-box/LRR-repeat protein 8 n=1 Tax=Holothuria leucospilota TaxID=206669 RepID=A0A9Q1C8G9_HOLLE|nr:F-box/LRR-repeat protein 8 [Holothuria leucospilota]